MSWGQGAYYVRIKPPYICTYYLYRFLCTGRDCGKISWVAAEYIIIRCGCVVIAITLRLWCIIIYVAAVYILYIQYVRTIFTEKLVHCGSSPWVEYGLYTIFILYILYYTYRLYVEVRFAYPVLRYARCAYLNSTRFAVLVN